MIDADDSLDAHALAARRAALRLAGGPEDFARRASVYHHLFRHSGGNHVFPLLAAHGAIWGRGHIARGMLMAQALLLLDFHRPARRRARRLALTAFADAFRDIHRRICIEVSASYGFTAACGERAGAERHVDPSLLDGLNRCHHARRQGRSLARAERAALFEASLRWEQRVVVGPAVEAAASAFRWDRVRALALRPTVRFAYMPRRETLRFADFSDADERIEKALRAYAIGEEVGWPAVEAALAAYRVPETGFRDDASALSSGPGHDGLDNSWAT